MLSFRKRASATISSIVLFVLISTVSLQAQDAEIKSALRLLDLDKPSKAREVINQAVVMYPTVSKLYYYQGYIQLKAGEVAPAIATFDKGITLNDKDGLNYAGKGHALMLQKKPTEAKLLLDKALSFNKSKDVPVLQAVAEAYSTDIKNNKTTISLLEKARGLDDRNVQTRILLGDAYLSENNGGSAVSSYEWAAQYDSKNGKPHYKVGLVYLRSQNYPVAEEALLKAIAVDPDFTLAYKELGEFYYLRKEGAKAVSNYEKYLSLTENPEKDQLRYAFILFMARDFVKANEAFKKLSQKPDATSVTLRYYAFSLFESGKIEESKNVFDQYFAKAKPEDADAADFSYYGKLLMKLSQDSLAAESLQKSLALEQNQPEVLQLLADSYYKRKKYQEAIDSYKKLMAIRQKPLSQDYFSIGRAYYFNTQFVEADSAFQKLTELQPNMTVGFLWAARTKSSLDPESEGGLAKPYYEKLIEKAILTPEKNKNDLIEAYSYLGYYHILKNEAQLSKSYWQKVLELKPDDEKANEALKALK